MPKLCRLPFELSEHKANASFQLIHSDVWRPTFIPSIFGFRLYISFIDDFSKFTWIYPLKHKSEAY